MDAWVVVEVESPRSVYTWREQAEAAMRASGKPAMTKAQANFSYYLFTVLTCCSFCLPARFNPAVLCLGDGFCGPLHAGLCSLP